MLSKIEVGKTYRNKNTKEKRTINFIGDGYVFFTIEDGAEAPSILDTCLGSWEEIPEEMWVNIYPGYTTSPYKSKQEALKNRAECGVTYRLVKE